MVAADGVCLDDGLSSDHSGCCYTRMHLCVYARACDWSQIPLQGSKKDLKDRLVAFVKKMEQEAALTSPDPLVEGMADITLGT